MFFIRLIKLNYTDNTALPIVLSEWKYKGMYVLNNVNVGKMSNEESVFVKKA